MIEALEISATDENTVCRGTIGTSTGNFAIQMALAWVQDEIPGIQTSLGSHVVKMNRVWIRDFHRLLQFVYNHPCIHFGPT